MLQGGIERNMSITTWEYGCKRDCKGKHWFDLAGVIEGYMIWRCAKCQKCAKEKIEWIGTIVRNDQEGSSTLKEE